jgi:UDP-glucose:(heptosyl)LPS alpha-1,3-glucosyltransferase
MTRKLRIALVRQRFNPFGGAERIVARALPALEQAGVEVALIARRADGWGARRVLNVDPFYVGNLWRDWSFARAARSAWRREGFDLVQSHERIPGCDIYRAGDGVHRRWLDIRTSTSWLEGLAIALNPYHRYVCKAERDMFEHPRLRAVICNSRMVQEEIRRAFRIDPRKLHLVYSGVDLEYFHPRLRDTLRGAARAELGCSPRDIVFVFVGSGFARKGLEAAIDALARSRNPSFWLAVVGRDRSAPRFQRQAQRVGVAARVRFLGGQEDVRPFYAAADCFILPSRYDPFPNTALEALAMGLPLIVSSHTGAAEIVEEGAGWVCRPDDAEGIARLMHEADKLVRSGERPGAARNVAERFGLDTMAERLTALYRELVHEPA